MINSVILGYLLKNKCFKSDVDASLLTFVSKKNTNQRMRQEGQDKMRDNETGERQARDREDRRQRETGKDRERKERARGEIMRIQYGDKVERTRGDKEVREERRKDGVWDDMMGGEGRREKRMTRGDKKRTREDRDNEQDKTQINLKKETH